MESLSFRKGKKKYATFFVILGKIKQFKIQDMQNWQVAVKSASNLLQQTESIMSSFRIYLVNTSTSNI